MTRLDERPATKVDERNAVKLGKLHTGQFCIPSFVARGARTVIASC
jgi:hypothetical protein